MKRFHLLIERLQQRKAKHLLKSFYKKMRQHHPQLAFFNYDLIGRDVACEGYYEKNFLECLARDVFPMLKSHNICLDIGANIGNHSVFFADYFQKIYAYEPNLRPFKLLEANAMLKNNISTFDFGLSNTSKKQKIVFDPSNIGAASLVLVRGRNTDEAVFQLKCLDKVLKPSEAQNISFMKIDVEGSELNALKGATKTIKNSKPVIALEVLESEIQNGTFATKEFLETLGYKFFYTFAPKSRLRFIPKFLIKPVSGLILLCSGRDYFRPELTLIEAPQKFDAKEYPMVVCSPYDLKA